MKAFNSLPENQKQFLQRHVIDGVAIAKVAEELDLPRKMLSEWYDNAEIKPIREELSKVRSLWKRKNCTVNFLKFYDWFKAQDRKCEYCEITEVEIARLIEAGNLDSKRLVTRGKTLELDRKLPNETYDNLNNLTLCCYWCNNAKTDTFSHEEFKVIGKTFREIWKKRLAL